MCKVEQIDAAIRGHKHWKAELKNAIITRSLQSPIEEIGCDTCCDFGKWLFGPLMTPEDKASEEYLKVVSLHSDFHKAAQEIVILITSDSKPTPEELLVGCSFSEISWKLIEALNEWKAKIQKEKCGC